MTSAFDNRTAADLTEASLGAALDEIKRSGARITITPTMYIKPPWMTDAEFWEHRRRLVEEAAPLIREATGCDP